MTVQNPEALFQKVAQYIEESNALIAKGAYVQLNGLDAKVSELCEAVLTLSGEQREEYADRLQQLVAALQILRENMDNSRDAVNQEMHGLNTHKKANKAYQKIELSDQKKKNE
jgi:hypothetical protein